MEVVTHRTRRTTLAAVAAAVVTLVVAGDMATATLRIRWRRLCRRRRWYRRRPPGEALVHSRTRPRPKHALQQRQWQRAAELEG